MTEKSRSRMKINKMEEGIKEMSLIKKISRKETKKEA